MIKNIVFLLFILVNGTFAEDYKINKIIVNQIDGERNNLAVENTDYYSTINNLNDFIIMVNVIGGDPKKDYFQKDRKLVLSVYDKLGKKVYTDIVDTSYLHMGSKYHWFLIRKNVIRCGKYKIYAELKEQTRESKETTIELGCGE